MSYQRPSCTRALSWPPIFNVRPFSSDKTIQTASERIDSKTASGSVLFKIGRPITTRLAPSAIASEGDFARAWSSACAPGNRTPGVTISAFGPQEDLVFLASWGLQTTPYKPDCFANSDSCSTVASTPFPQPEARTACSLKLVKKGNSKNSGLLRGKGHSRFHHIFSTRGVDR